MAADEPVDSRMAERLVTALYRNLLDREPDSEGLLEWIENLNENKDPDQLIANFIDCEEFRQARQIQVWKTATSISRIPGVCNVDYITLKKLFDSITLYWRQAGLDPEEIFYSVLTNPRNRRVFSPEMIRLLINKGAIVYNKIHDLMVPYGSVPTNKAVALDFGCGVGRLAINAANHFCKVYGVDCSRGHLDVMTRNIEIVDPAVAGRIKTIHLENLDDLCNLPRFDYCFSLITLQHNPPPLIAYTISTLLERLNHGGIAALHVPIHDPFYRFDLSKYLSSVTAGSAMETHILPREDLRKCIARSGCTIRDSVGTAYTKGIYSEIFLITRP